MLQQLQQSTSKGGSSTTGAVARKILLLLVHERLLLFCMSVSIVHKKNEMHVWEASRCLPWRWRLRWLSRAADSSSGFKPLFSLTQCVPLQLTLYLQPPTQMP